MQFRALRCDQSKASLNRRDFLEMSVKAAVAACFGSGLSGCSAIQSQSRLFNGSNGSKFGFWRVTEGLPEFVYTVDHSDLPAARWDPLERPITDRHFHMLGNRAIQMQVSNTGDIALFDESQQMRWLVYGDDSGGTGHSLITEADGVSWGSSWSRRPLGTVPTRIFGVNYFTVCAESNGLSLKRTVTLPDGEYPWVLIKVELSLANDSIPRVVEHREEWQLRPRLLETWQSDADRDLVARDIRYEVRTQNEQIIATESLSDRNTAPIVLALQALKPMQANFSFIAEAVGDDHPMLVSTSLLALRPGVTETLWYRFGRDEFESEVNAEEVHQRSQLLVKQRLPQAKSRVAPFASTELPWHAAALTGGASRDRILPGHTLNQASIYGYGLGANAAARDALQHALPLIYTEPDLALSVLKNTCAWAEPNGDLPYALGADRSPIRDLLRPSDQNLWALWLASEYAVATGDLEAFSQPQSFHPKWRSPSVSLKENLIRQYRFFVDDVGLGARGHVRILNADWNDMVLHTPGVNREALIDEGGSVLNSAMASWVLTIFSGLMRKLNEPIVADEALALALELKERVANSWNGRWVDRAYSPDGAVIGRDRCWLEVQPWAILCGAVSGARAEQLLSLIDSWHRADSPLGARIVWPPDASQRTVGQGTKGGIWYSINMTLIWAAAKIRPDLAWDEWRRLSLSAHVQAYPGIWEGTLSGPDAWNAPESDRPGRTWTSPNFSQQAFPVNNLHAHSQPILAYLRLLGVEPNQEGGLDIKPSYGRSGSTFSSRVLCINEDGTGWINTMGPVELSLNSSKLSSQAGRIRF